MIIRAYILCAFLMLALSGCEKNNSSGQQFLLPWPDENSSNKLQYVTIESLNSPYKVSGPFAQVYAGQGIYNNTFTGDPVEPNLTLIDGNFHPMDVQSSQALAIYAHMERLAKLDQKLGIFDSLSWPRKIGIDISVIDQESGAMEFNNARYLPHQDLILFLPANSKKMPLSVNPGIVAHEHFHSYFNAWVAKEFLGESKDTPVKQFNMEVILRGWNEGLADYYAYYYVKDHSYLSHSLEKGKVDRRKLSGEFTGVRSATNRFDLFLKNTERATGIAYLVGTDIARVLYELIEESGDGDILNTHAEMIRWMGKKLPRFSKRIRSMDAETPMEPTEIINFLFLEGEEVLTLKQCQFLKNLAPLAFQGIDNLEAQCL